MTPSGSPEIAARALGFRSSSLRGCGSTLSPVETSRDPPVGRPEDRIGSSLLKLYSPNIPTCTQGSEIGPSYRVVFSTEQAAAAAGYRRGRGVGC